MDRVIRMVINILMRKGFRHFAKRQGKQSTTTQNAKKSMRVANKIRRL